MNAKSIYHLSSRLLGALLALFALNLTTQAQNGTWINTAGGSWTNFPNWSGNTIASGSGSTADFSTLTLASSPVVTLDGARTIGNLVFGDVGNTFNWTLSTGGGGPLTLGVSSGSPTITVNNGIVTNSLVLTGTQGMTKSGNGTLRITSAATYSGGTTVNNGNLVLTSGGGTGTVRGALTINAGASVTTTVQDALGYTGGADVSTLTINGGNFTNTSVNNESYATQWLLTGGTVTSFNPATGAIILTNGFINFNAGYGITTFASSTQVIFNAPILLRGTPVGFTNALGTVPGGVDMIVNGVINGGGLSLVKNGPGTLALGRTNSFGELIVQAGTVQLAASSGGLGCVATSPIYVTPGAELDCNASDALGYSVSLALTNAGTIKKINAQSETLNRPIILTNGTMISTAYNNFNESYELFGNYIRTLAGTTNLIGGIGNFGLRTSTAYFTNEANSTLKITCVVQGYQNAGTTPLNKYGPGTLILAATNIYAGATVINGGTLHVDGSTGSGAVTVVGGATLIGTGTVNGATTVQSGGTLAADPDVVTGTLSISNSLTFSAGSTNAMRINKTGGTTASDLVQGLTSVAYGGTLTVTNITSDANQLAAGDVFYLFNASSYSGGFASYNLPALPTGLTWDKSQLTVNGSIQVLAGTTPPTFTPAGGGYIGSVSVTISSDTGSTIYYTTDGSNPTNSVTRISGTSPITGIVIPLNTTETLMAYATNSVTGANASPVVSATYATAPTGIWTNTAGGSWPVAANWNVGAVGNGSGVTADFSTLTLTGPTTISLSGSQTIGTMLFEDQGNAYGWILNGSGSLTVDAGATVPSIVVSNQGVNISTTIIGTNGLVISGAGSSTSGVILSSLNNNFTNLFLSGVSVTNTTAAASASTTFDLGAKVSNSTITVNSNAVLDFTLNNIFGGGNMTNTTLPTLVIGGTVYSTRYNAMPNIVLNGGILDQNSSDSGSYQGYQFLGNITVGGTAASTISTDDGKADHLLGTGTIFNVAITGAVGPDLTVSAPLANASGDYSSTAGLLIKTGAGTLSLAGANTYTGSTIVSNGTLEVDGSTSTGAVVVNGGIVDGTGTINGPVTVNNGGKISAGTAAGMGALGLDNVLALPGGTAALRISKTGGSPASDLLQGMTSVVYGGTLKVTDVTSDGSPLVAGDMFQLFSSSSYSGAFATLNLPILSGGLVWDLSGLTANGTITISANAATPIFNPVSGGYVGALTVTLTSESGATIHYTTDGSDPTSSGTVISGTSPVTVVVPVNTPSLTINAYASKAGKGNSGTANATYSTIATPTWTTPSGGNWSGNYNWLNNVVANGGDVTADFSTLNLGGSDATVTLDIAPTVGNLIFGDQGNANNWIIADGGVGPLTLAVSSGSSTITVNNQTNFFNAVLTGTNGLAKAGAGTLVLGNFDTYTGNTVVNGGNLILATNSTGKGTIDGTLTVNPGALVTATAVNALGYTNATNPHILWVQNLNLFGGTFNNASTGDEGWGLQINLMGGTLAATGTGAHLAAGQGTVINTFATNVPSVISGTINARENNPSNQIPFNVASSGGAASPDLLVSGSINAQTAGVGIVKNGPGVMSLANTNGLSGATIVSNGVLQLLAGGGPVGTLANSAITVESGAELQTFTGDGLGSVYSAARTLTLYGTLREINTNSETLSRPITMINGLITANSGAGLTAGGAILAQGSQGDCFNLYGATAILTTTNYSTNYISLPAGSYFALRGGSFSNADNSVLIVNGVLNGWGGSSAYALIKTGAGSLILNSNNTYAGSTVVSNGTLEVDGATAGGAVMVAGGVLDGTGTINGSPTIQAGGTLMSGTLASMGTLSISNALTFSSGSTNVMRINKAGVTHASDLLQGMLSVNYGGTLTVTATGDTLAIGDTFTLFKSSSYSGTFDNYNLPALATGLSWDKSQLLVNGSIRVIGGTGTPAFNPPGGNYVGAQSVTISSDAGSTIFYTTDGSDPTTSGTRISGASPISGIVIPVSTTETLRAYATNSGVLPSLSASATYVTVPTAIWINAAGGSWPVFGNWFAGTVGDGSGVTADFSTLTLPASATVTLSSPETVGSMLFADRGNANGWTLNGTGPLTLDAGATIPSIVVSNQSVVITTPLAGTNGLVKVGAGTLVLTNFETYTGNTIVNAGNLTLGVGGGSGTLSSRTLTINPGASVTATIANALGYSGTGWVTNLNVNGSTFTTAILSTNVGDQGWGLTVNMMGGTLASIGTNSEFSVGGGWVINTIATNVSSTISGTLRSRNAQPNNLIPFNVAAGSASPDLLVSAVINNYQTGDGIVKTGAGLMVLTATNTFDGVTIVSNGTLEVDGSIANGGVTVSGGILTGSGTIAGAVMVNGGTLAAGTVAGIGTLTINNTLDLTGGTATMRINKTGSVLTNDNVQGLFGLTYGNTLKVTASGNALAAGDKFKLFYSPAYNGSYSAFNLPALAGALAWDTSQLATNGSIQVVASSVNTTPPTLANAISGGNLILSWPADHTGWRLLVQTNHLAAGLSSNTNDWTTVTGSSATNQVSLPVDATKATEFYRLVYP